MGAKAPKGLTLLKQVQENLVITFLLFSHDGVERQTLVSLVDAVQCVVVVEDDDQFLYFFASICLDNRGCS